jgi:hypothetical protein
MPLELAVASAICLRFFHGVPEPSNQLELTLSNLSSS